MSNRVTKGGLHRRSQVIRDVRDFGGRHLEYLFEGYDGSAEDAVRVARALGRLADELHPDASNVASRTVATDERGEPAWVISPNFAHVAQAGTAEARYILGDTTAAAAA